MEIITFQKICNEQCGLHIDEPVLVGFSGGADSLSLLILLKTAGFTVVAAHFNHQLRDTAILDEKRAKELAETLDIPIVIGTADVKHVANEKKLSIEEAARQTRYQWLFEEAEKNHAKAVAVGHTADDQIETLLMHLIRGAGLEGLLGMAFRQVFPFWHTDIPVVRPLLTTWREETEQICVRSELIPVKDETNFSELFFRNRIRLELIPYLKEYNPKIKKHLHQTSRILSEESDLLRTIKEENWADCYDGCSENWLALKLKNLQKKSKGIIKPILRRAVRELVPARRDLDFEATEKLVEFASSSSRSGEMQLPGDLWVQTVNDRLLFWKGKPGFTSKFPQIEEGSLLIVGLNETVEFQDWRIMVLDEDLKNAREAIRGDGDPSIAWLDKEKLIFPLTVRGYLPGERFSPLGMTGKTIKLSDFWVNRKIPRQARKNWPVIYCGQSIVWIAGAAVSETAAITHQTNQVVRISLQYLAPRQAG